MHKGKCHFILSCGSPSHFAFQGQMWTEGFWFPGTHLLYDPGVYRLAQLLRPQSPSLDEFTQHLILPLADTHTHTHTHTHTPHLSSAFPPRKPWSWSNHAYFFHPVSEPGYQRETRRIHLHQVTKIFAKIFLQDSGHLLVLHLHNLV